MTTNAVFIKDKLVNFVKYCREVIASKESDKYGKFMDKIDELEDIEITFFITIIVDEMIPFSNNPGGFVEKMLNDNDLTKDDLTDEEFNKCSRYISCWCNCVS